MQGPSLEKGNEVRSLNKGISEVVLRVPDTVQDIEHTRCRFSLSQSTQFKSNPRLLVGLALCVGLGDVVENALLLHRGVVNLSGLERCPLVSVW
jgi:hypothetical protein